MIISTDVTLREEIVDPLVLVLKSEASTLTVAGSVFSKITLNQHSLGEDTFLSKIEKIQNIFKNFSQNK